ncbi:hypothetical protein [Mesorhizobium sp. M0488]|uniref:hypothetical protein n=1 Tax=Mesorhizobium sp. M0488 TaxID=2956949 RepID=UPI0033352B1B
MDLGDQDLGGLALDEQAEGAAGNAVARENGFLDGGEVIDVRRAGRADLGRHAGLENLDWIVEKARSKASQIPPEAPVFVKRYRSLIRAEL